MVAPVSGIKEKCINGMKSAVDMADKTLSKKVSQLDTFLKTADTKQKTKAFAGAVVFTGALVLAGKCLKELKAKIIETKNK